MTEKSVKLFSMIWLCEDQRIKEKNKNLILILRENFIKFKSLFVMKFLIIYQNTSCVRTKANKKIAVFIICILLMLAIAK
jgi:hypothetical protein